MPNESLDQESGAIQTIISTLEPLNRKAQQRVLAFSLNRLGITKIAVPEVRVVTIGAAPEAAPRGREQAIRALKREKSPRFATHMAAVVGYYLSEIAPREEKKNAIGHQDIRTYFKKAGFKMPKSPTDVLIHAAQSGYFDYLGSEQYRLTPAGRDLVLNELPPKKK
jgi:hypothetical protein